MDIVSITNTVSYGDAASNHFIAMDQMLKGLGFKTALYANRIDPKLDYEVLPFAKFDPKTAKNIVFHFASGTSFVNEILKLPQDIILYYQNITPAEFFKGISWGTYRNTQKGRKQLLQLRAKTRFAWAASEYSRLELENNGFQDTSVIPIVVNLSDYKNIEVNPQIYQEYKDDKTNLLFVGRIAPNKKHEDLIRLLYYYKNFISSEVRLILVGNPKASYVNKLKKLMEALQISGDVIMTGKVSFQDMCSYYKVADAFVCMSEHEGFLVPLVEAMNFRVPIFAFDSSAVPHTLGNSGVLFDEKDFGKIAHTIDYILQNKQIKSEILTAQDKRLGDFSQDRIAKLLKQDIERYFIK